MAQRSAVRGWSIAAGSGTPTGEIREEVVVAESEARLRRELEERGLVLLGVRPASLRCPAGLSLPSLTASAPAEGAGARVPRLQPGTGHPPEGRDAARAVARHPAAAGGESHVQGRPRRRPRARAGRRGAVGSVRDPR